MQESCHVMHLATKIKVHAVLLHQLPESCCCSSRHRLAAGKLRTHGRKHRDVRLNNDVVNLGILLLVRFPTNQVNPRSHP